MKNLMIGIAACLTAAGSGTAFTAEEGFGVGLILGSPSGLSGSLPVGASNAVNAVLGYNLGGGANLHLQADYVWHRRDLLQPEVGKASVYYGPGVFTILSGDPVVGIRGVAGIDYRFDDAPIQVFLEFGPGINVIPNTNLNAAAGLGFRYFF